MQTCPACGRSNRASAQFCGSCRAPLQIQSCPACGQTNRVNAKHCGRCGTQLIQVCAHCNQQNRRQSVICQNCGKGLVALCPHCQTQNKPGARYCKRCASNLQFPGAPQQRAGTGNLSGLLRGRYQITRKLAQGGQGAVYQIKDIAMNTDLALKEMSLSAVEPGELAEAVEAFHREADLLRQLSHPNLARAIDQFSHAGAEYLVMELVQGETLDDISAGGVLAERDVLGLAFQLCDVLGYLHQQKPPVIYRDLKPANIMVETGSGLVKLIDFGIVRFHKPGKGQDTKFLGTPGFSPPEQYGNGQTDARSDIFALGVTLHVLLTSYDVSQNPWSYPLVSTLNSNISKGLEQAIDKATQTNMGDRYQSMAEMRDALMTCKGAKRVAASLPSGKTSAPKAIPQVTALPAPSPPRNIPSPRQTRQSPFGPSSPPTVTVLPKSMRIQVTHKQTKTEKLVVASINGHPVQGQVLSSDSWIRPLAESFVAASEQIEVELQSDHVQMPTRIQRPLPNFLRQAWEWAEDRGASRRPWDDLDDLGMTLAAGLPALIVGGVGQVLLWLVYRHAYYWVPGPLVLSGAVEVSYPGGSEVIPVDMEVLPGFWQKMPLWSASVLAVAAEIGLIGVLFSLL